jgi:hypothetical protein
LDGFSRPAFEGGGLGENEGDVRAGFVGDGKGNDGLSLDRGSLARWILSELGEGKWVGCCPVLSSA